MRKLSAPAQAVIWSEGARAELERRVAAAPEWVRHIDGHFLSRLRSYTLNKALVVQRFPVTENQGHWCYYCATWTTPLEQPIASAFVRHILGTDVNNWQRVPFVNALAGPMVALLAGAIAAAVVAIARAHRLGATRG